MGLKLTKEHAVCFLLTMFVSSAFAQQPGSVQYNTQVLPANGIVTRSAAPERWGTVAIAKGKGDGFGWTDNASTPEEAKAAALDMCKSGGGDRCEVLGAFVNSCAALAFGTDTFAVTYTAQTRRSLSYTKKKAIRDCGAADCKIIRSGCTAPI
jgi:hypothetical protein